MCRCCTSRCSASSLRKVHLYCFYCSGQIEGSNWETVGGARLTFFFFSFTGLDLHRGHRSAALHLLLRLRHRPRPFGSGDRCCGEKTSSDSHYPPFLPPESSFFFPSIPPPFLSFLADSVLSGHLQQRSSSSLSSRSLASWRLWRFSLTSA